MSYERYISTTAKKLKHDCPSTATLRGEIKRHCQMIESQIKENHRAKLRYLKYSMVTNFDVPNMTNAEAQQHIFAGIIDQLTDVGFDVGFTYDGKNICYFEISWRSSQDIEDAERQKSIIKAAMEKKIKTSSSSS